MMRSPNQCCLLLSNRKMYRMTFIYFLSIFIIIASSNSNTRLVRAARRSRLDLATIPTTSTTLSYMTNANNLYNSNNDNNNNSNISNIKSNNNNNNNNDKDKDKDKDNHIKKTINTIEMLSKHNGSFNVPHVSSLPIKSDQSSYATASPASSVSAAAIISKTTTTTTTTPTTLNKVSNNMNAAHSAVSTLTKDGLRASAIVNEKKNLAASSSLMSSSSSSSPTPLSSSLLSMADQKLNVEKFNETNADADADVGADFNIGVDTRANSAADGTLSNLNALDNRADQVFNNEIKEIPMANFEDINANNAVAAASLPSTPLLTTSFGLQQQQQQHKINNINKNNNQAVEHCDPEVMGFEIVTGYVFSAPGKMLDSLPGTLMLTDCLEACQGNGSCRSINYETGLCVLFSANADQLSGALTKSQFPVFTIYAQKSCLAIRPCARAWCVDRVQNYKLNGHAKRSMPVQTRRDCFELCLGETEFTCRSANYHRATNLCELSEMDRITLAGTSSFQSYDGYDYLENNCAEEPNKLCEFKRLSGRILKTVDSVYQDVGSIDECRDLCINSPYRCHSYDFGDTGDMVCRLSHHSRATLSDVQEPYLEVPEAATYELASCYNVTIECGAGDMVARIRTSKLFDGKVYAKGSPKSCAYDVDNSLEFELRMGYQDLECNVRQQGMGRYMNDVVIQHHDTIVTSSDLGLAVTCQYDLTNKSVSNDVDLNVKGDIEPALSEEVIVDSPNVIMKITSRDGEDVMRSAEVGDPLALKFEILDEHSPYEIFVRELVAMDGSDNAEITLIDSNGCPTDHFIMGPIYKSSLTGKVLLSHFDAFKFPSSELVQFRALITPCMPTCNPTQCNQEDISGERKSLLSFGRRRRSLNYNNTETAFIYNGKREEEIKRKKSEINGNIRMINGNGNGIDDTTSINDITNDNNSINKHTRMIRDVKQKPSQEDMLLVQSIQITDKFGFDRQHHQQKDSSDMKATSLYDNNETVFIANELQQGFCVNTIGLIVAGTVFLLTQLAVIAVWTYLYQRRRKLQAYSNEGLSNASNYGSHNGSMPSNTMMSNMPNARTESLCKLYADNNFPQRHGRQF